MPRNTSAGQLIPRTPSRALTEAPRAELAEQFTTACGLQGRWRLVVTNEATGVTEKFDLDEPYVLVGRSSSCQVRLNHPDVGFRHGYLQVLGGRVYCFDLDSEYGIRWGSVVRKEGLVTVRDVLHVGPFSLRLSQAAAFGGAVDSGGAHERLANEPLTTAALRFVNASGRSSRNPLRPLRQSVTLLGRSGRCQLKLSDTSVSQVHSGIVHVDGSFWVVDLLGRDGTKVNGRAVRCTLLEDGDEVVLGRFRMQFCVNRGGDDSVLARGDAPAESAGSLRSQDTDELPDSSDVIPVAEASRPGQEQSLYPAAMRGSGSQGLSENTLLAMLGQFAQMQQQLLLHSQQQITMLAQLFGNLHSGQQTVVMEQLQDIHQLTSELGRLRSSPDGFLSLAKQSRVDAPPPAQTPLANPAADTESIDLLAPDWNSPADVPVDSPQTPDVIDAVAEPAQRERPRPAAADSVRGKPADHQWVTQRIHDLERERNGRWQRLLQLIGAGRDLN
jgi:hypothetical protein